MRFLAIATLVATLAQAMPDMTPVESSIQLASRDECVNCVKYCCSTHGNCNYMNCAASYCGHQGPGNAFCVCKCKYGK